MYVSRVACNHEWPSQPLGMWPSQISSCRHLMKLCTPRAVGHVVVACRNLKDCWARFMTYLAPLLGSWVSLTKASQRAGCAYVTRPPLKTRDVETQMGFPRQRHSCSCGLQLERKHIFCGPSEGRVYAWPFWTLPDVYLFPSVSALYLLLNKP